MKRVAAVALTLVLFSSRIASAQDAPPPAAPAPAVDPEAKRNEAKTYFETGIAHFDRSEWSAALAAFLRSRELFPTRSATKNAAVCLRKESRFDESLEMYEALLREFKDLAPADRTFAATEIESLRGAIGSLEITNAEPDASIVVDGRARGTYPPPGLLRVPAGSHVVRLYKEGFAPFERRVDVASRQVVIVEARLPTLTQAGRLSVVESASKSLDVVVDNIVVGKTPWEGSIAPGAHTVALRGEEDLGTQPATTAVKLGEVTRISLSAEPLTSALRLVPVPAGATVSIDAVVVGQGVWEGKLREGLHRVEVAAEGFIPVRQDVSLVKAQRKAVDVSLERDPSSPLWQKTHPSRVFIGADVGPLIGLTYGGDVRDACTGSCSAAVPFGLNATARAGYELSSGITLGLDVGYLFMSAGVDQRAARLDPRGLAANQGTTDEELGMRGIRFGPNFGFRFGEEWPVTLRLGGGVFLGTAIDARKGTFTTSTGTPYAVDVSESAAVSYVYIAPEARVARRFGTSRFEVGLGISALAFVALKEASWRNEQQALAAPAGQQGDGVATYPRESFAGSFMLGLTPALDARYAF